MLDLDKLGPFAILQFAAALLIVGGTAYAVYRGTRDRAREWRPTPEQRWFFDGPLVKVLDLLQAIYRELREQRRENEEANRERREQHKEDMDVSRAQHGEHMDVLRDLNDRLPRRRG